MNIPGLDAHMHPHPYVHANAGKATEVPAWGDAREADFGGNVGDRRVWLLDNPDVYTLGKSTGVPTISSRWLLLPFLRNLKLCV